MWINQRKNRSTLSLSLFFCLFFIGCHDINETKRIRGSEFDREGHFINDSIPNGEVKFYVTKTNNHVATREFKHGVLEGKSINYFNGRIIQISHFKNGLENGFTEIYDSTKGFLKQANYYFYGKQFGPSFLFEANGAVKSYHFKNFENQKLFSMFYDSSLKSYTHDEFNNLVQITIDKVKKNNEKQLKLFTYLIYPPKLNINYKIAFYNDADQQLEPVQNLTGNGVYWEGYIDYPKANKKPALIIDIYDSVAKKTQVIMSYIK